MNRKDDDGSLRGAPEESDNFDAIDVGEAKIEQYRVQPGARDDVKRLPSGRGFARRIPASCQAGTNSLPNREFVVNYQYRSLVFAQVVTFSATLDRWREPYRMQCRV